MCFLHKIGSFFSSSTSMDYRGLNKKDDDGGIKEVEDWKQRFSIELVKSKTDNAATCNQTEKFAQEIIRDIDFPVTDSNFEFIKEHLGEVASQREYLRAQLVNTVEKINTEKEKIKSLQSYLIGVYSNDL